MYRLGVLADIHGNLPALEAVLDDIQHRGIPDAIWVLGDLVAFFPWLSETIDRLRSLSVALCLQGNTDRYLVTGQRHVIPVCSEKDWAGISQMLAVRDESFRWMVEQLRYKDYTFLRDLPYQLELELHGFGRIVGVHAIPGNDEGEIRPDTPDGEIRDHLSGNDIQLLLFGHTHTPMQREIDGIQLVNPGSVGLPGGHKHYAAYALLEFADHECQVHFHQVAYDVESIVDELQGSLYPGAKGLLHKLRQSLHE